MKLNITFYGKGYAEVNVMFADDKLKTRRLTVEKGKEIANLLRKVPAKHLYSLLRFYMA